jgi:hypothetical protein
MLDCGFPFAIAGGFNYAMSKIDWQKLTSVKNDEMNFNYSEKNTRLQKRLRFYARTYIRTSSAFRRK